MINSFSFNLFKRSQVISVEFNRFVLVGKCNSSCLSNIVYNPGWTVYVMVFRVRRVNEF
jgi:hypothetical protein